MATRVDYRAKLEEALDPTQRQALRAVLVVLLEEINRRRAFDVAIFDDVLREMNTLRERASMPALAPSDLTASPPPQLTSDQVLAALKQAL